MAGDCSPAGEIKTAARFTLDISLILFSSLCVFRLIKIIAVCPLFRGHIVTCQTGQLANQSAYGTSLGYGHRHQWSAKSVLQRFSLCLCTIRGTNRTRLQSQISPIQDAQSPLGGKRRPLFEAPSGGITERKCDSQGC